MWIECLEIGVAIAWLLLSLVALFISVSFLYYVIVKLGRV